LSEAAALITAAGSSRRWGGSLKKEYHHLQDCPVLVWAARPFLQISPRMYILVTVPHEDLEAARELLAAHLPVERLQLVPGGTTRQESVWRGLEALEAADPAYVLIHDGARPWVSVKLIAAVLAGAQRHGACVPIYEPADAAKRIGPCGQIVEDLPRGQLRLAQTPQGFAFRAIVDAHRRARAEGRACIDDAEVYRAYYGDVFTVVGERANRKLTFREDLQG
jgi:2-C-methyl-D-erythritol 4-phosphate cytidylyltransferase